MTLFRLPRPPVHVTVLNKEGAFTQPWHHWLSDLWRKALPDISVITATVDPASVGANNTAEEAFTVTGVKSGDFVVATKPTLTAGLLVGDAVAGTDQVTVRLANVTGSAIDPGSETWSFLVVRS